MCRIKRKDLQDYFIETESLFIVFIIFLKMIKTYL